jgi:hypothetical protein
MIRRARVVSMKWTHRIIFAAARQKNRVLYCLGGLWGIGPGLCLGLWVILRARRLTRRLHRAGLLGNPGEQGSARVEFAE